MKMALRGVKMAVRGVEMAVRLKKWQCIISSK